MPPTKTARRLRLCGSIVTATLLQGALALPASAQFITSDRTVAGGNPLNGNYIGQTVWVGVSNVANGIVTRVPNVQVDVIAPARFSYSDQTGGGLAAYSNSVVRVYGGTFDQISSTGAGGGVSFFDTSTGFISGGTMNSLTLSGAAPGAAGAQATVSGGLVQGLAYVINGTLNVSGGTLRSQGAQSGIAAGAGSVVNLSSGLVQSDQGAALYLDSDSAFRMTGGTATGGSGGNARWGVRAQYLTTTAVLRGGTVNGGMRTEGLNSQVLPQAALGGSLTVNGGVFAYAHAAVDVTGGSYTPFSGADASFFAMGTNTINFYGTGLGLSAPVAGQVFELNNYLGNFYTFTSGTFSDGQSAVGLRLFDALSVAGNNLPGGFTLNPSPVPEPGTWLLMLLALPAVAAAARRERRT